VSVNMGTVSCGRCGQWVRRKLDGQPYKHSCTPVSEAAPMVEETTTQGDDVAEISLASQEYNDSVAGCSEPQCTCEGHGGPEHELATIGAFDDPAPAHLPVIKGPWFGAMYGGRCSVSECEIFEGDRIRADGYGGYECEDCGDETLTHPVTAKPSDWQAQASAAARRHMAGARGVAESIAYGEPLPAAEDFDDPAVPEPPKPVMSVSGQPKKVLRDHLGRYAVVLPGETELELYKSSGNPVGRTRATTFNKKGTDKKNINDWGKRNVLIGAARRRDLVLQATGLTHEDDKDRLNALVVQLEETAGSKVGSDLGTYLHEFTEYIDAGLKTWQDAPEEFRRSLHLYTDMLAEYGLEPIRSLIERTTIIREYGWVCGTFDRIFFHRPSGQYVIGDLKTGKTMDYGKNEVETQLWIYAHGVNQNGIYDWNTRTWGPAQDLERYDPAEWGGAQLQVSETVGVVIHMPVQGPKEGTVELLWADLENGAEHARVCAEVAARPNGKMKAWGDGPAPLQAPAEFPWEARFASVTSNAEATALWKMAKHKGITGVRLNELVAIAQRSLAFGS
jgi:hypothetical protein